MCQAKYFQCGLTTATCSLPRYRYIHTHSCFKNPSPLSPHIAASTRVHVTEMKIAVYSITDYFSMVFQFHVENFDTKLSLKFTSLYTFFLFRFGRLGEGGGREKERKKTENSITK